MFKVLYFMFLFLLPLTVNGFSYIQETEVSLKALKQGSHIKTFDVNNHLEFKFKTFEIEDTINYYHNKLNGILKDRIATHKIKASYLFLGHFGVYKSLKQEKNSLAKRREMFSYGTGFKYSMFPGIDFLKANTEIGYLLQKENFKFSKNYYRSYIRVFSEVGVRFRMIRPAFAIEYLKCVSENSIHHISIDPKIYLTFDDMLSFKFNFQWMFDKIKDNKRYSYKQGLYLIFNY